MRRFRYAAGFVLDMDGCLIRSDPADPRGGVAIPGAADAVRAIRALDRPLAVFTNGTSHTPAEYVRRLAAVGIEIEEREMVTPSVVAAELLAERHPGRPVLAFGDSGVVEVLAASGVPLCAIDRPTEAAAVYIGWDSGFDRAKLQAAAEAIWAGARLYLSSDGRSFAGRDVPVAGVAGAIGAGLTHVTGCTPEVFGKPSALAMQAVARRLGVPAEELAVIGDELGLEVSMGRAAGAATAAVLTGMTRAEDVAAADEGRRPDLVLQSIADLAPLLTGRRWDIDERGSGIADAAALAPSVEHLLALCRTAEWVTEDPEHHLLPHLTGYDGLPVAEWRITDDGVLELDLDPAPGLPLRELRRRVWALLGSVAEPSSAVFERSEDGRLVFDVVTGVPVGPGEFSTHGHTLRLRLPDAES
jgi:HAD superfamily hydrolase (TIGR01450 family)